ncbi:MAG: ABC transporter substrate-binding protein [Fusobacteriaceae bacterium]
MKLSKKLSTLVLATLMGTTALAKEKIVFWHAMGGNLQTALEKIITSYNNSQNEVEIEAIYQGSYEELLPKFKSVQGTKEAPNMVQMNEITTEYMYKSGAITPIDKFIKEDNFSVNMLQEQLLNYYTVDGTLYSMPFNSSAAVLLYNKEAFKEVGLDPEKAPKSFREVAEYSKQLTKKDERNGFALIMNSWFMEQSLANMNSLFVNENNGRAGKSPTGVEFENGNLEKIFNWLGGMYAEKTAISYGRDYGATRSAFSSGKVAMYMDSSSGIRGVIDNSDFEVGTAFIPNESGEFNGVIIGGGSLWIANSHSDEKQKKAWDFIKFAISKDVQAQWALDTGYYAVNKESYASKIMLENYEKYPQMQVALNQLNNTKSGYATSGAVLGVFPEVREKISVALETVYEGKKSTKEIVKTVTEESNRIIQRYNRINK